MPFSKVSRVQTAEWSLWGEWHAMQCVFHCHKGGLCHGSIAPGRVLLWQTILLPHLQGRSSLGLVPPTIPTRTLGWKFSQSIEAMSQLKNLGHGEKEEEHLEVVMDAGQSKVLQPSCPFRAFKSQQDSSRAEASRSARRGLHVNGAQVRRPSHHCVNQHRSRTIWSLEDNADIWYSLFPLKSDQCIHKLSVSKGNAIA